MNWKEKAIRIREWCKNHKTEIIITAAGAAGCGLVCVGAKKLAGMAQAARAESQEQCQQIVEEIKVASFVECVRERFLNAGPEDEVTEITDIMTKLKDVVPGEGAVGATRHGDRVLCIAQHVAAEHAGDAVEAVKGTFPGIDDLEIWMAGTVRE